MIKLCVKNCVGRAMGKTVCVMVNCRMEQNSEVRATARFCCGGC